MSNSYDVFLSLLLSIKYSNPNLILIGHRAITFGADEKIAVSWHGPNRALIWRLDSVMAVDEVDLVAGQRHHLPGLSSFSNITIS